MKHGQGQLLNDRGEVLYEGEYSDDLMNGKGKLYLPNEYFYEGEFCDNKIKGKYYACKNNNIFGIKYKEMAKLFSSREIFTLGKSTMVWRATGKCFSKMEINIWVSSKIMSSRAKESSFIGPGSPKKAFFKKDA